jgi:photosystem II stability/assembly factor-like uncharacterized protein
MPGVDIPISTHTVAAKGDTLLVGAYRGTIYRSLDFGKTWIEKKNGLSSSFYEAYTILRVGDSILVGAVEGVYRSGDWGEHWLLLFNSPLNVISLGYNGTTLFAATEGGIFKSTDMGNSWSIDNVGFPTDIYGNIPPVKSMTIVDSLIFVCTRYGVFRKVIDGTRWDSANNGIPLVNARPSQARCMVEQNKQIYLGIDNGGGTIFYSSDFGNSWHSVSDGPKIGSGNYTSVYSLAIKDSCIFAGTEYGIYRSLENGKNWVPCNTGLPLGSASDLFISSINTNANHFLASTWSGLYQVPFGDSVWLPMFVQFPGRMHYSVLGSSGTNTYVHAYADYFNGRISKTYHSSNSGVIWNVDTSSAMADTYYFFNVGNKFYAGRWDLFVFNDDAMTWTDVGSDLFYVNALIGNDTVLFAGYGVYFFNWDEGGVYVSTNKGLSWDDFGLHTVSVRSLALVKNNLVAHARGLLLPNSLHRTTTDRANWMNIDSLVPPGITITSVLAFGDCVFAGTNHGVFSSSDAGTTWQQVSNGLSTDSIGAYRPVSIMYANSGISAIKNTIFAGIGNTLFLSSNAGASWQPINLSVFGDQEQIVSIAAEQNNLIVSTDVNVWRRSFQELYSGDTQIEHIPLAYNLAQNYPNPFNPSTTIAYDLPKRENVSIKIFNTLGQEIVTLVSGQKDAGRYFIEWNAGNVSGGVYFCRLQAQGFAVTKKMIILK